MSVNHPTLETPRLILRPFDPQDAKLLHSILNQEKILQYFLAPRRPHWSEWGPSSSAS